MKQIYEKNLEKINVTNIQLRLDLLQWLSLLVFQEVPVLFSDNFDCQTLDEFVKGTLENDLTDHTIYLHAIEDESYAARSHSINFCVLVKFTNFYFSKFKTNLHAQYLFVWIWNHFLFNYKNNFKSNYFFTSSAFLMNWAQG